MLHDHGFSFYCQLPDTFKLLSLFLQENKINSEQIMIVRHPIQDTAN